MSEPDKVIDIMQLLKQSIAGKSRAARAQGPLTAHEVEYLKDKPIVELDDLDIGVLFDHADCLRDEVRRAHAEKIGRPCVCVYCEGA